MKIAILSTYFGTNVGGAEVSTKLFVDAISLRKGFSVSVITANQKAAGNIPVYKIPLFRHYPKPFIVFDFRLVDYVIYLQIKQILQKIKPDILHIQEFELSYPAIKAAKSLGIKTIITVRDHRFICNLPFFDGDGEPIKNYTRKQYITKLREISWQRYRIKPLGNFLYPFLRNKSARFRYALNNADMIVAVSCYIKNIAAENGVSRDNINVIYNLAPEVKDKSRIRLNNKKSNNGFTIFAPGRLEEYKGFHVLIKAFAEVVKESEQCHASNYNGKGKHDSLARSKGINLIIAGTGSYEKELKALADKLCLNDRIIFTGKIPLSKIYENYANCDIVCSPSLWAEPISRVLWESFAFNKPVIATSTGGTPEIIKNMKTGILIKPNDTRELRDAILSLINDKDLRKRIVKNSSRFIKSHNNRQLNLYIKLYKMLMKDGKQH